MYGINKKKFQIFPKFPQICIEFIKNLLQSSFGTLIILSLSWSFSFHMLNEIRHLIWDLGYGFDSKISKITGVIIVLSSFALPIFIYLLGRSFV